MRTLIDEKDLVLLKSGYIRAIDGVFLVLILVGLTTALVQHFVPEGSDGVFTLLATVLLTLLWVCLLTVRSMAFTVETQQIFQRTFDEVSNAAARKVLAFSQQP